MAASHLVWPVMPAEEPNLYVRLTIDGVEYEAPIMDYPFGSGMGFQASMKVVERLEYILEMHEAFYG